MRLARLRRLGPAAIVVIAAGLAACGQDGPVVAPGGATPTLVPGASALPAAPMSVEVTAEDLAFAPTEVTGPAAVPFSFTLRNRDAGIPHNIVIRAGVPVAGVAPAGPDLFSGAIFTGLANEMYAVPALPAGVYTFSCEVHPNMVGTLTLR